MDMFMPSEIARLVLGYLNEMDCVRTIHIFLTENSDLKEYVNCLQQGREYPTSIGGKTLINILHDYCFMKSAAEKSPVEICKLINEIDGNISQVKYFIASGSQELDSQSQTVTNHLSGLEAPHLTLLSEENQQFSEEGNTETTSSQLSKGIQTTSVCTQTNLSMLSMFDQSTQTQKLSMMNKSSQLPTLSPGITSDASTVSTLDDFVNHSGISNIPEDSLFCPSSTNHLTSNSISVDFDSNMSLAKVPIIQSAELQPHSGPVREQHVAHDSSCKIARRKNNSPRKRSSNSPSLSPLKLDVSISNDDTSINCNSSENISVTTAVDDLHANVLHERMTTEVNAVVGNTCSLTSYNGSLNFTTQLLPALEDAVSYKLNSNITTYTDVKEAAVHTLISGTESNHELTEFSNKGSLVQDHETGLCTNDESNQSLHRGSPIPIISANQSSLIHAVPSTSYQIIQISGSHFFPRKSNVKFSPGSVEYEYVQSTLDLLKKRSVTCLHKKTNARFSAGYPRRNARSKRKESALDGNGCS